MRRSIGFLGRVVGFAWVGGEGWRGGGMGVGGCLIFVRCDPSRNRG